MNKGEMRASSNIASKWDDGDLPPCGGTTAETPQEIERTLERKKRQKRRRRKR